MNGYMSNKLTFTNGLYPSPKYKKKLESFRIATTDAHYFIDDLFNMILLNIYIQKLKIRIVRSAYNNSEDWNTKSEDNLYYSYHHKDFKKQIFLLSHLKEETNSDYFREFYGARIKYNSLKKALED